MQFLHNGNCLIINLQQNALKLHEQLSMLQFLWLSAFQMKVKIFLYIIAYIPWIFQKVEKGQFVDALVYVVWIRHCLCCMNQSLFTLYESVMFSCIKMWCSYYNVNNEEVYCLMNCIFLDLIQMSHENTY